MVMNHAEGKLLHSAAFCVTQQQMILINRVPICRMKSQHKCGRRRLEFPVFLLCHSLMCHCVFDLERKSHSAPLGSTQLTIYFMREMQPQHIGQPQHSPLRCVIFVFLLHNLALKTKINPSFFVTTDSWVGKNNVWQQTLQVSLVWQKVRYVWWGISEAEILFLLHVGICEHNVSTLHNEFLEISGDFSTNQVDWKGNYQWVVSGSFTG